MDIAQVLSMAISFLGIFLLLMIYTYIDKLEKTGCQCSESPYRSFIKIFPMVAVVYFVITMALAPGYMVKVFGSMGSLTYLLMRAAFSVLFFVFFVLVIVYVRNLITLKCECSEDIRREIMYIYAILEVVLISLSVVFVLLESIIQGAYIIGVNTVKGLSNDSKEIGDTVKNPLSALKKVPKNISNISKSLKKTLSKSKK
jgi:hypothetical protein